MAGDASDTVSILIDAQLPPRLSRGNPTILALLRETNADPNAFV
jgi:hypothetical protein